MKKFILFLFSLIVFVLPRFVSANNPMIISATVTPTLVSVTSSETAIGYSSVPLSSNDVVPVSPISDPIISVIHNGNVNEDFAIRGENATSGGVTWTLAATTGANQYVHKFGIATPPGTPSSFSPLTTSNATFATNLAPADTRNLKVRLSTPTSTSTYNQFSTSIYLVATQH